MRRMILMTGHERNEVSLCNEAKPHSQSDVQQQAGGAPVPPASAGGRAGIKVGSLVIDRRNYMSVCRKWAMPFAYFENVLGGCSCASAHDMPALSGNAVASCLSSDGLGRGGQDLSGPVCFYDIETDDAENFLFGFVTDEQGQSKRYDDAAGMVKAIAGFRVAVAFNSFRFDNRVLHGLAPDLFDVQDLMKLECHLIKGCINVDALVFYRLWKPFAVSHKLEYLARDVGMVKVHVGMEDKEAKCAEDCEVLRLFWPHCREMADWYWKVFRFDAEWMGAMAPYGMQKLRRWCLQVWVLEHGIVPELVQKRSKRRASFYMSARRGLHRDLVVYDVKSAYPMTVIRLDCGLWQKGDFALFEKWLVAERGANPGIQEGIKWICNALIGDMNCTDGLLYDQNIMVDTWNTFKGYMERWVAAIGRKHVKYAYTDCVMLPAGVGLPAFPESGYEVAIKHKFKWLVVYNIERLLGVNGDGKVHRTHFNRVPAQLRLYDYLEDAIDRILLSKDAMKFLAKPFNPVNFRELPDRAFSIVIRKDGDTCNSVDYLEIWPQLQMGFNEVYYGKGGRLVRDRVKIDYRQYEKLVKNYLRLYRFRGKI